MKFIRLIIATVTFATSIAPAMAAANGNPDK